MSSKVFLFLFFFSLVIEILVFQVIFRPGFIAPDIFLILLITRAFIDNRNTLIWAIAGGLILDLFSDTVGLYTFSETLAVYLFILITEKLLFRNFFTFFSIASLVLLLRKISSILLMRLKYSFEVSITVFLVSFLLELIMLGLVYFYIRRKI